LETPIKTKKQKIIDLSAWIFVFLLMIALLIAVFDESDQINLVILIFICLITLIFSFISHFNSSGYSGKIKVDENGVEFTTKRKHFFLSWDDIEYVVITRGFHIRVFTSEYQNKCNKMPYDEYPMVTTAYVSESYVYMPYSEMALSEVKKYFKKEIINEYILYLTRNRI